MHTGPDCNGFLAAVEVDEAGHLACLVLQAQSHFEFPYGFQAPVCIK
jgi:hypothetical protein